MATRKASTAAATIRHERTGATVSYRVMAAVGKRPLVVRSTPDCMRPRRWVGSATVDTSINQPIRSAIGDRATREKPEFGTAAPRLSQIFAYSCANIALHIGHATLATQSLTVITVVVRVVGRHSDLACAAVVTSADGSADEFR